MAVKQRAMGEIRLWPQKRQFRGSGDWSFGHDPWFHESPEGVLLRPGHRDEQELPARARGFDSRAYLDAVISVNDHIEIRGIAAERSLQALNPAIENLYIPLSCRDIGGLGGSVLGKDELADREGSRIRLTEILPQGRLLLIEGQPGAGKTTFLRFVACMLARDARRIPCPGGGTWRHRYLLGLEDKPSQPPMPILLRLGELGTVLARTLGEDDRERILEILELEIRPITDFDCRFWETHLSDGRAWLLLDGLDEVDPELRERLFRVLRDAIEGWPRAQIIITSRPLGNEEINRLGFLRATIEPFQEIEIQRFLHQWVAALYLHDAETAVRGEAGLYLERLKAAILARPAVRVLAGNPVMLTCLAVVHWNQGELPNGRARVYRAVIYWLLQARADQRRKQLRLDIDFADRTLSQLALDCMSGKRGKRSVVELADAIAAVLPAFERERPELRPEKRQRLARRWLLFECEGSGVIEQLAGDRLRFWHLTFQEYLAALELARPAEGRDWWPLIAKRLEDAQWRDAVELFSTCLYELGRADRVDRLMRKVLGLRRLGDLASEAWVTAVIGRLLPAVEVCGYKLAPQLRLIFEEARERVMAIFEIEGARRVPVELRIAAAEALGRGGDPRIQPEVDNFLPVPGVSVKFGRYPVTVEEYRHFVDARGYEIRTMWDETGSEYIEKEGWLAPGNWSDQLESPNQPVVQVSWYEASAYCRWLSDHRRQKIRLPTVAEWEAMATHPDGRYPWGKTDSGKNRLNREDTNGKRDASHPSPVGIHPTGIGPYGHLDLAGNVWQWCSGQPGTDLDEYRSLRGASWLPQDEPVRVPVQGVYHPRSRLVDVGFRIALAS